MKKTILFSFITLIFSLQINAQEILDREQDGEIHFAVEDPSRNYVIGFTPPVGREQGIELKEIAYAFVVSSGILYIFEYDNLIMSGGLVVANDNIVIRREGSNIKYFKNDLNIRTIATDSSYELQLVEIGENAPEVQADFDERLNAFAFIYNISSNDQENAGIIDVNPTGGVPPYQYEWSHGSEAKYINNLNAGSYSVRISDAEGHAIDQTYEVSYLVTAMVPKSFDLQGDSIIKLPNDSNEMDMMISENSVSGNGLFKAKFKGENNFFIFGLTNSTATTSGADVLPYSVVSEDNQLFFTKNGTVYASLGPYEAKQNLNLKISEEGNQLSIFLDNKLLHSTAIEKGNYHSAIAFPEGIGSLTLWVSTNWWKPTGETDYYATLTKKLDGSFYKMKNYVKFKYKEKYNDNVIDYKIYDWKREVKMSSANQPIPGHKYGINYHRLAAHQYLDSEAQNSYYTLEVKNDKNEVYKMRFYFEKVGIDGMLQVQPISENWANCCPEICKCPTKLIIDPTNPIKEVQDFE